MKDKKSKMINFIAARLPRRSAAYLFGYLVWLVALWFLSEMSPGEQDGMSIPHLDKVGHFGYFFGGGGLLAGFLGLKLRGGGAGDSGVMGFCIVVFVGCLVGGLDEYHQSFTPGRSGNDTGDWIADILGKAVGAWVMFVYVLPRLIRINLEKDVEIVANTLD